MIPGRRPDFFCNGLQYIFGGVAIRMVVVRNVTFVQACTKQREISCSNSIVRQNEKKKSGDLVSGKPSVKLHFGSRSVESLASVNHISA